MQDSEIPDQCQVLLQPSGWIFTTQGEQTILQAALRQGVRLPSACRNGTCRACLCKKVAGDIRYRIDWPGVSKDEKEEGWILPCVAVAVSDLQLLVPQAKLLNRGDASEPLSVGKGPAD